MFMTDNRMATVSIIIYLTIEKRTERYTKPRFLIKIYCLCASAPWVVQHTLDNEGSKQQKGAMDNFVGEVFFIFLSSHSKMVCQ